MPAKIRLDCRKVKTAEEFAERTNDYLGMCIEERRKPTVAGLALHLGFESRQSVYDYKGMDEFRSLAQQVFLYLEDERLQVLMESPAGVIFELCNNYGYRQPAQMQQHTGANGGPIAVAHTPMPADVQNELDAHKEELTGDE